MPGSGPFEVEIKAVACNDNPVVRSKRRKQHTWSFDSREEAEEWIAELDKFGDEELLLKKDTRRGAMFPDAYVTIASDEKQRRTL